MKNSSNNKVEPFVSKCPARTLTPLFHWVGACMKWASVCISASALSLRLLSGVKPMKEQLFLLSIQSKTGKTVNCTAPLPLALWSSLGILSACARRALANKRERGEERYLPENGGISTWGLQSRLWSRAAEARASERAGGRRAARLSYYATASLSLSAARRSTELFNEAWLSHNVFCSWMSLSLGLDFFSFFSRSFIFFTPPLHSLLFGHHSGKGVATKEPLEILEVCQSDWSNSSRSKQSTVSLEDSGALQLRMKLWTKAADVSLYWCPT